jgi:HEAT repeat protein
MDYRLGVIRALAAIGPTSKEAIDTLVACLNDRELRPEAAMALSRMGKDAVKPLLTLLNPRSDPLVRRAVVIALGEIGPDAKSALAQLQLLAKTDRVQAVREAAVDAIKKIQAAK